MHGMPSYLGQKAGCLEMSKSAHKKRKMRKICMKFLWMLWIVIIGGESADNVRIMRKFHYTLFLVNKSWYLIFYI